MISSGKLKCAVMLDFPPMGMRNASNEPEGFDFDTCHDLGAALGVETEIVETASPDPIPALISGRADVAVASASDTLERAKTIGFSVPYAVLETLLLTRNDVALRDYDGIKSLRAGGADGSWEGMALEKDVKAANGSYKNFQDQANLFLACSKARSTSCRSQPPSQRRRGGRNCSARPSAPALNSLGEHAFELHVSMAHDVALPARPAGRRRRSPSHRSSWIP